MSRDRSNPPGIRSGVGSTVLERVAAGQATAEDLGFAAEQSRLHQQWLETDEGKKFLKNSNAALTRSDQRASRGNNGPSSATPN